MVNENSNFILDPTAWKTLMEENLEDTNVHCILVLLYRAILQNRTEEFLTIITNNLRREEYQKIVDKHLPN